MTFRYTPLQVACVLSLALFLQGMLLWKIVGNNFLEGSRGFVIGLLVLLCNLAYTFERRFRVTRRISLLILLLVAASAIIFLSNASAYHSDYGIWKSQGFLLFILMPCVFILVNFRADPAAQTLFFRILLALTSIPLLLPLIIGQKVEAWSVRWVLGSLGYDIIGISRLLGVGCILALSFALNSRLRIAIPLLILFLLLLYGQVTLSERGPMLALAISLIIVSLLWLSRKRASLDLRMIELVGLILIIAVVISAFSYVVMLRAGIEQMELRLDILKVGWGNFLESPLFGIGIGNFIYDSGTFGVRQFAHNIILEILVEMGLVGLLVLGSFFAVAWTWHSRHSDLSQGYRLTADISLALLIFSAVAAMFSGDLPTNNMLWVTQALVFTAWCGDGESAKVRSG